MHYIKKLPLLLALFAAIICGMIGLARSATNDKILLQMMIAMIVFYIVGYIARYNLTAVYKQVNEKKEKEKTEALKEEQRQKELKKKENLIKEKSETENISSDDFEPLKVSRIIREELERSDT